MRLVLAPLLRIMFRPRFVGRENMPAGGPCFIITNHCQVYDAFMVNLEFYDEPTAGLLTEEYFRGGLVTWMLRGIGVVATRKFQPQSTPVREIMRLVRDNRMVVIMPEGGCNWDGVTLPTIASTGKLFRRLGLPVHPVILHNNYLSWPRWAYWPRRIRVTIEFKPPLFFTPEMTDDEVARMVDDAILWSPDQGLAQFPIKVRRGFRPATGITKLIFRCPTCGDDGSLREKRGRYLLCDACGSGWKVGGDSYLTNMDSGERRSSTAYFHKICALPRDLRDYGAHGPAYLRALDLPVYRETDSLQQTLLGKYHCLLREDRVELIPSGSGPPVEIPLEDIQTISIEKTYKLQLRTEECLYQLNFGPGSALHWDFDLRCLHPALGSMLYRRKN
ncbi:MAG: 1-acyl-sn-glycerol-3-phosphate acyltransferase, partial [Candidatus Marinimicrobia bacterium]|nr:1-acyl-sn-glycerol-3-phosphate acyltransferase [Candidatus Neomarinimicrobiota bacterium]